MRIAERPPGETQLLTEGVELHGPWRRTQRATLEQNLEHRSPHHAGAKIASHHCGRASPLLEIHRFGRDEVAALQHGRREPSNEPRILLVLAAAFDPEILLEAHAARLEVEQRNPHA